MNQPLPTDAIDLERQEEPQADHLEIEDLSQLWEVLKFDDQTRVRDRAIVAVLSHGLRASEASVEWQDSQGASKQRADCE